MCHSFFFFRRACLRLCRNDGVSRNSRTPVPCKGVEWGLGYHSGMTLDSSIIVLRRKTHNSRTGHCATERQAVKLSNTRCHSFATFWAGLVSFAVISQCVASQRAFIMCVVRSAILWWMIWECQHFCIQWCLKLWEDSSETHVMRKTDFGDNALGRTQIFEWIFRLKHQET